MRGITAARLPKANALDGLSGSQQFTSVGYGAHFLGGASSETNIVAGTTISGDTIRKSTNVDYRTDTPAARAFLGQFVALP